MGEKKEEDEALRMSYCGLGVGGWVGGGKGGWNEVCARGKMGGWVGGTYLLFVVVVEEEEEGTVVRGWVGGGEGALCGIRRP